MSPDDRGATPLLHMLGAVAAPLSAEDALSDVRFAELAPPLRPYVVINMVASADGRAAIDGRTAALGGATDRELFHNLRAAVDAVMVGARTASLERYGRLVRDPALRALRLRRGLQSDPLACVVSGRLELDGNMPLLQDEASHIVLATGSQATLPPTGARVDYLRHSEPNLDLASVLARLHGEYGVRSVLCEGGPSLNSALFAADVVDELYLTLAPRLVGGPGPLTILAGPSPSRAVELELLWCLQASSELFLRYRVNRGG